MNTTAAANPYTITAEVGAGVTELYYSDLHAGTIVNVSASGKTVQVQQDTATLLNGPESGEADALVFTPGGFLGHMSGKQRHTYTANPDAGTTTYTLRPNGRFVAKGDTMRGGRTLVAGRSEFYDYNF